MLELIPAGRAVSVEYDVFPLLVGGGLYARSFEGSWRDIGTPASYLAANLEQMPAGGLIDPSAQVAADAEVTDSVVGPGLPDRVRRPRRRSRWFWPAQLWRRARPCRIGSWE